MQSVGTDDSLLLRPENFGDESDIRRIHEAAFGRLDEADLVTRLRHEGVVLASLVADVEKRVVAHICFSRMSIETATGQLAAVALAPLAVLPDQQRRGIGGKLIKCGLHLLSRLGERVVIVVGHPDYYPRFGFSTNKARFLVSPFPPDAFMALELRAGALDGVCGKVRYPDDSDSASAPTEFSRSRTTPLAPSTPC